MDPRLRFWPRKIHHPRRPPSIPMTRPLTRRSFVLIAVLAVTSFCLVLTAAMLSARSHQSYYINRSAEKIVTEAAAFIETQDFLNRSRNSLSSLSATKAGGFLNKLDFFTATPYRRVEIRSGTAVTSDNQPPLVYLPLSPENLTVAMSQNPSPLGPQGVANASVLSVPALWVPDLPPLPTTTPLGVDDPYSSINARASYVGVSAFSKPRGFALTSGSWTGFSTSLVMAVRSFPASAFTALQFSPSTPISYSGLPSDSILDAGQVYSAGSVAVSSPVHFSRLIALGGVTSSSPQSSSPPSVYPSPAPGSGVTISTGTTSFPGDTFLPASALSSVWPVERFNSLRGYVVTPDNGGVPLIQNGAVSTMSQLIAAQQPMADCSVTLTLSQSQPPTNGQPPIPPRPIIAAGGLQISQSANKTLVPSNLSPSTNVSKNPPFLLVPNSGNAPGGKIVFDPSKLIFDPASAAPYSLYINNLCDDLSAAGWTLCVSPSPGCPGISIVCPQAIYLEGNFITTGAPSLLSSPRIYACLSSGGIGEQPMTVTATVITAAPAPTSLFLSPSVSATAHPPAPSYVSVIGSSIAWEAPQSPSGFIATYPQNGGQALLTGSAAPSLVPAVSDVRVSASLVSPQQQTFK